MFDSPIHPDSDEFQFFLIWLVDKHDFQSKAIIDVVYGSHKYKKEMEEYLVDC